MIHVRMKEFANSRITNWKILHIPQIDNIIVNVSYLNTQSFTVSIKIKCTLRVLLLERRIK